MLDRSADECSSVCTDITERLCGLRNRLTAAAERADRDPREIRLVGVSKGQPLDRILAALANGVEWLGENYVQEALARRAVIEMRGNFPRLHWLGIGRLQSNKAKDAVAVFDGVESVDRRSLADALHKRAHSVGCVLEILIQVNICGEAQKGGVTEGELPDLLAHCASLSCLRVRGLMTIPAASADPEASRPVFARLRWLRDRHRRSPGGDGLTELSMGMSKDFEVAIEEGATRIRLGTALFGDRLQVHRSEDSGEP